MLKSCLSITALTLFLSLVPPASAQDLSGTYREGADGDPITIEKGADNLVVAKCKEWTAQLYWDAETKIYKAVFRYNASTGKGKASKTDLAVGFQTYAPQPDGSLKVTYQWDLSSANGKGSYVLKPVK